MVRLALRDREREKNCNGKRYGVVDKIGLPTVIYPNLTWLEIFIDQGKVR
jgi:hypothetical protein